jgi:hypothetical protein
VATPTNDITTISNSTISSNIAPLGGAGVLTFCGQALIKFSTNTENDTNDFAGSGVVTWGDPAFAKTDINMTIVAGNHHTDVAVTGGFVDTFDSLGYNVIGTGSVDAFNEPGDLVIGTGDPGLGPLADNGGPTLTHALEAGSPAIDAGDPDFVAPPDFDQRGVGFDRVRDGDGGNGAQIDIGAFEVQGVIGPALPGDYNDDDVVDTADYVVFRKFEDTDTPLENDGVGGEIGPAHYQQWTENFGESLPPESGNAGASVTTHRATIAQESPADASGIHQVTPAVGGTSRAVIAVSAPVISAPDMLVPSHEQPDPRARRFETGKNWSSRAHADPFLRAGCGGEDLSLLLAIDRVRRFPRQELSFAEIDGNDVDLGNGLDCESKIDESLALALTDWQ